MYGDRGDGRYLSDMATASAFAKLRRRLAPFIRPLLERCPPIRAAALGILRRRHRDAIEIDGYTFRVEAADFGVTLELESTGAYEPLTRRTLSSLLGPGMTFVDIGRDQKWGKKNKKNIVYSSVL